MDIVIIDDPLLKISIILISYFVVCFLVFKFI